LETFVTVQHFSVRAPQGIF